MLEVLMGVFTFPNSPMNMEIKRLTLLRKAKRSRVKYYRLIVIMNVFHYRVKRSFQVHGRILRTRSQMGTSSKATESDSVSSVHLLKFKQVHRDKSILQKSRIDRSL